MCCNHVGLCPPPTWCSYHACADCMSRSWYTNHCRHITHPTSYCFGQSEIKTRPPISLSPDAMYVCPQHAVTSDTCVKVISSAGSDKTSLVQATKIQYSLKYGCTRKKFGMSFIRQLTTVGEYIPTYAPQNTILIQVWLYSEKVWHILHKTTNNCW